MCRASGLAIAIRGTWVPVMSTPRAATGGLARAYAALAVALRYVIVLGWVAAVALAVRYLPALAPAGGVASLVPANAPALQAEATATRTFGEPLDAQVAVVQRSARGLPTPVQVAAARAAANVDTGQPRGGPIAGLAGAVPIPNTVVPTTVVPTTVVPTTGAQFPGSRERSTTIVTFLYFRPGTSFAAQTTGGELYARRYASGKAAHLVGVTGVVPATYQQGVIIAQRLPWVEFATVAAIWLIVAFFFLSLGAPVATLLCAATSYLLAIRVVAWVTQHMHVPLPPDAEPVLIVLLLGVTTDYSVFFMSGMRNRLAEGLPKLQAARLTTAEYAPIILVAGVLVAAATGSLGLAKLELIRALGPALATTVAIAMLVSLTLAPALIAIFGNLLFWPGPGWYRKSRRAARAGRREAIRADRPPAELPSPWHFRERIARLGTARPAALIIAAACVLAMLGVGWKATSLRLGAPLISALPGSTQEARAQAAAGQGFAAGILSPTEVLVFGNGAAGQTSALDRLQRALAHQPGVAGVIGPATVPALLGGYAGAAAQAGLPNPMLARSGNAARYGLILRTDPLGPTAVRQIQALQRRLPALTRTAGLTGVRVEVGGETAAAGEAIRSTTASIASFAPIMLIVTLVLLILFLSALIAPLYLLAASILALFATLGVTVWVFQHQLGYDGLVYYVPFTVGVLLVSLGADYNVFVVGRIWEEARRRPLRNAIAVAASQASRAITVAGITLASSFALLALIPLQQFREVAVAMAAGVVIDTVVARSLLVPALVALFGRVGMWPGRRPFARRARRGQIPDPELPQRPPARVSGLWSRGR
jgi:putative drug exporter of the RND superfamily